MAVSPFRPLRDALDGVFAQGLRFTSSPRFESALQACATLQLSQPATLLEQVQQQVMQENFEHVTAETLVKVLQILKQAELLTCKPGITDVSSLKKTHPDRMVYIDADHPHSDNPDDLLSIPNPFVRTYQFTKYFKHADSDAVARSIEILWCDYSLMTAIAEGLTSRPAEAFKAAQSALTYDNWVMQLIALKVLETIGSDAAYRHPIIDLLRERAKKTKEPMKYVVMETIAKLEGTHRVFRLAQQKFFNDHISLIRQLSSRKKSERGKAIKALAKTKNPCFTHVLLAMLDDPEVAFVVPEPLFKIGAFAAIPRLAYMLDGPLQHNAALTLYKFGDRRGLEYFLRGKMRSPLENFVKFTDYGPLLLFPLMYTIKHIQHIETYAPVCREIFDACRSHDFAQRIRQYAEADAELAQKLMIIIKHAYPGQYTHLMKETSQTSSVSTGPLSKAEQYIITTTLGENLHTIIARLKFKYLLYTILPVPDKKHMITLDGQGEVVVWNTTSWKKETTFELPKSRYYAYLQAIAMTPDGKRLFTTDNSTQSVRVFDFGKWNSPTASLRHTEKIYSIGTSADRAYILGGGTTTVKVWEYDTWREITELTGHQQGIEVVKAIPGKPFVVTGDRQGWLRVWEINTWKPIVDFHVKSLITNSVAFSPDGKYMIVVDTLATYLETNVRIWETDTWQQAAFFAIPSSTPITCFAFTPDGKYLLTGSNVIKFLEVGSWNEKLTLTNADTRALAVLPDTQHVIAGQNVWKIDWSQLA